MKRILLLGLALAVAGCATKKYMMSKPLDAGMKAVYNAPFDKVRRAAQDALSERGFHFDRDKDEKWLEADNAHMINSSKGLSAGTAGQYARIVITKGDSQQTVFVLVESKAATRDAGSADEDVAKGVHSGIEKRVTAK
jgi:hypothetical protein